MEENKLNLCDILKGYEGEIFYSRCFGPVELVSINYEHFRGFYENSLVVKSVYNKDNICEYYPDGKHSYSGEQDLFPAKDQLDWNKWAEEEGYSRRKTWSDLLKRDKFLTNVWLLDTSDNTAAERAALALLKINLLIDNCYGGVVTEDEWSTLEYVYVIEYDAIKRNIFVSHSCPMRLFNHIAFRTKELAAEFLQHKENIDLIKDYYMLSEICVK